MAASFPSELLFALYPTRRVCRIFLKSSKKVPRFEPALQPCIMHVVRYIEILEFLAKLLSWYYRGYPQVISSFWKWREMRGFRRSGSRAEASELVAQLEADAPDGLDIAVGASRTQLGAEVADVGGDGLVLQGRRIAAGSLG